jgi:hypothetical protein
MTTFGVRHVIFVVVLASVCTLAAATKAQRSQHAWNARSIALVWMSTVVISCAVRQVRYPSDMALYVSYFRAAPAYDSLGRFLAGGESDKGFFVFQYLLAKVSGDQRLLMGSIALVICLSYWSAIRLLVPPAAAVVVFFATVMFPFFAFYVSNTARQGMAVSLVLLALSAASRNTRTMRVLASVALVVAVSVHLSAMLPAAAVVMLMVRLPSVKFCLLVWLASAALFVSGLNARLTSLLPISDQRFSQYSGFRTVADYAGGVNRLDFFALSALLIVGVIFLRSRIVSESAAEERTSQFLVCGFVLFNAIFLCLGFLAYSDRVAAYSWLMTPVVVGYLLYRNDRPPAVAGRVAMVISVCAVTFATQGWPELLEQLPIVG